MSLLTKLFGNEGVVRFEAEDYGGGTVRGKMNIECIGYSKEQLEEKIKEAIYVEKGVRIKTLNITGFYET